MLNCRWHPDGVVAVCRVAFALTGPEGDAAHVHCCWLQGLLACCRDAQYSHYGSVQAYNIRRTSYFGKYSRTRMQGRTYRTYSWTYWVSLACCSGNSIQWMQHHTNCTTTFVLRTSSMTPAELMNNNHSW